MLGPGVKRHRPPSCAGLSFPTDTRAGHQRQHSHALPPPHPSSRGLEPQPLLFFLLALCPGRLCLALAPDPPGSQQRGGWGRGSWCGLPQRLAVNPHLSALLSWKAPGCQCKRGFLAGLPAGWSQIPVPRVRERMMKREVCRGQAGVSSLQPHVQSQDLQGPPPHTQSRLTLALQQHTTFTAGKSLAHLTQTPQAVEQALAFPCLPGRRLA